MHGMYIYLRVYFSITIGIVPIYEKDTTTNMATELKIYITVT